MEAAIVPMETAIEPMEATTVPMEAATEPMEAATAPMEGRQKKKCATTIVYGISAGDRKDDDLWTE
jgi:hypothetical protein